MRLLFLEHRLDLPPRAAVDASGGPVLLPVHQEFVLGFDGLEAATLKGRVLRMLDRVFHGTLAIRIPYACRVRDDPVMLEHRGIEPVDFRLVQVRCDDALAQIVKDYVLRRTSEVPEGLLVKLCPHLLAGLPHHASEAASRVPQGHDEQTRFPVSPRFWIESWGALTVVDLTFLADDKCKTVERLGVDVTQGAHETLDAVVARGKAELINQILVDGLGIALQAHLLLDPFAMGFAGRAGEIEGFDRRCPSRSRWARGWRSLRWRNSSARRLSHAGGRGGGGICADRLLGFVDRLIAPDRLAIDAGELMDLVLARAALEQREYRALEMLLQNVHSLISFLFEGEENRRPAASLATAQQFSRWSSGGGN